MTNNTVSTLYLFVVEQTVSSGETQVIGVIEVRILVLVVELETRSSHCGLEHLFLSVEDGDLQVADSWLYS